MIRKQDFQLSALKSGILLTIFLIYTDLVCIFDVQAIGPDSTKVGFATLNRYVINLTGTSAFLCNLTDIIAYLSILVMLFFAGLGLYEAIKRKSILKVDPEIIATGFLYVGVVAFYALFEVIVINYRPELIGGVLEASYPSSHTMLVVCILGGAIPEIKRLVKTKSVAVVLMIVGGIVILTAVIGRTLCGIHWFSDIIGSLLLSAFLLHFRKTVIVFIKKSRQKRNNRG